MTRVRNGEVRAEASLVVDLVAKMHELSAQVGSYCELREELLGKQSLHEADLQKSRVQVQWLKSMTARALALHPRLL